MGMSDVRVLLLGPPSRFERELADALEKTVTLLRSEGLGDPNATFRRLYKKGRPQAVIMCEAVSAADREMYTSLARILRAACFLVGESPATHPAEAVSPNGDAQVTARRVLEGAWKARRSWVNERFIMLVSSGFMAVGLLCQWGWGVGASAGIITGGLVAVVATAWSRRRVTNPLLP